MTRRTAAGGEGWASPRGSLASRGNISDRPWATRTSYPPPGAFDSGKCRAYNLRDQWGTNPWADRGGATPGRIIVNLSDSARAAWAAVAQRTRAPPPNLRPVDLPLLNPLEEEGGAVDKAPTLGTESPVSSQAQALATTAEELPLAQAVELGPGVSDPGVGTKGGESERPPGGEGAVGDEQMGGEGKEGGLPAAEEPRQLRFRNPSGNRRHAVFHEQEGTTRRPRAAKKGVRKGKGKGKGKAPSRKDT